MRHKVHIVTFIYYFRSKLNTNKGQKNLFSFFLFSDVFFFFVLSKFWQQFPYNLY